MISGWGKENEDHGRFLDILQKAKLPIVPIAECAKRWRTEEEIQLSDNFLCAYKETTQFCTGDSGGAITAKNDTVRQVIGLIAYGPDCEGSDTRPLPGIYINVSRYGSWIMQKIQEIG